jgi:DNA recombination protein RmuC
MDVATLAVTLVAGAIAGSGLVFLVLRGEASEFRTWFEAADVERRALRGRLDGAQGEIGRLREQVGRLQAEIEAERRALTDQRGVIEESRERLADAFRALSADSLRANNAAFLDLARETLGRWQTGADGELALRQQAVAELVGPLRESLGRFEAQVAQIEQVRAGAYEGLSEQIRQLLGAQESLRSETGRLSEALRAPNVRGRWAEIQLQRVVELAGLSEHCDFDLQRTQRGADGAVRPDLIVRLPDGRALVVDAKAPMDAWLAAFQGPAEQRAARLDEHARRLGQHVRELAARGYANKVEGALDLVVLFLPHEAFLGAALERQPELVERAFEQSVAVTTPAGLIALLKTVAHGWRHYAVERNAREVQRLGAELHGRIGRVAELLGQLGGQLDRAVDSYNRLVHGLERGVLSTARRLEALDVAAPAGQTAPEPLTSAATRPRLPPPDEAAAS